MRGMKEIENKQTIRSTKSALHEYLLDPSKDLESNRQA